MMTVFVNYPCTEFFLIIYFACKKRQVVRSDMCKINVKSVVEYRMTGIFNNINSYLLAKCAMSGYKISKRVL